MNEQERAASERRMLIILGGGAALVALIVGLIFFVGRGVAAPTDPDSAARIAAEGMKQIGIAGEVEAARSSATGSQV